MPKYWITRHFIDSRNRLEPIEASNEQEAIDLTQDEDAFDSDLYTAGAFDESLDVDVLDVDVNEVEEG